MTSDWVEKTLGEVCTLQRGFDLPRGQRRSGQFPLISSSGPIDTHAEARVSGPGVVTGRSGSIGSVFFVEEDFWPLNTALYVKDFHGNDPRFVYYLLRKFDLGRFTGGAGVATLNRNNVHGEIVQVPESISEQKRIVAILDEALAGIDAAVAKVEKNLANARELFESCLNSVFTQRGDAWIVRSMPDVCGITSKLVDPREKEFIDLRHVGAGNMVSKTGELVDVLTAKEEGLKSGKFLFDESMVLYSKIRPYLMKVCRPDFRGLCSADVYPLAPVESVIKRDFLFYMLLTTQFTDYTIAGSDRAGMPKVNRDHLFAYEPVLPGLSEQSKIVALLDEVSAESGRLGAIYRRKCSALSELKQSVLHKAFTGELTAQPEQVRGEAAV